MREGGVQGVKEKARLHILFVRRRWFESLLLHIYKEIAE